MTEDTCFPLLLRTIHTMFYRRSFIVHPKQLLQHKFTLVRLAMARKQIVCEQALLFGRAKQATQESKSELQSHKGTRKGELATISHKFLFVLRSDEGNTIS